VPIKELTQGWVAILNIRLASLVAAAVVTSDLLAVNYRQRLVSVVIVDVVAPITEMDEAGVSFGRPSNESRLKRHVNHVTLHERSDPCIGLAHI